MQFLRADHRAPCANFDIRPIRFFHLRVGVPLGEPSGKPQMARTNCSNWL